MQRLSKLSSEGRRELARELRRRADEASARQRLWTYFPDDGPLARGLYLRHMEFFALGGRHDKLPSCPDDCDGTPHRERLMLAANRIGKTESIGAYEVALHATGRYPDWWPGLRFRRPVEIWAAGKKNETTRDVVQKTLFGPVTHRGRHKGFKGTGVVPGDDIGTVTWKRGVANLADEIQVRHVSGGRSVIGLKSYEQGRGAFEGTAKDIVWFDEEPPADCYEEAKVRTMTTRGHVLLTFTPLEGMSEVVLMFLPGGALRVRNDDLEQAVRQAVRC